ncbi:hypothetical protein ACLKA7_002958 [Drosophila subpalustris]
MNLLNTANKGVWMPAHSKQCPVVETEASVSVSAEDPKEGKNRRIAAVSGRQLLKTEMRMGTGMEPKTELAAGKSAQDIEYAQCMNERTMERSQ